jgi:hypothetical protein
VKQCSIGAVDEASWLIEFEIADVALAQIEHNACLGGRGAGLRKHRRGGVDPDHGPTRRERHWNRHTAIADGELDEWPVDAGREADVERHVLRHPR